MVVTGGSPDPHGNGMSPYPQGGAMSPEIPLNNSDGEAKFDFDPMETVIVVRRKKDAFGGEKSVVLKSLLNKTSLLNGGRVEKLRVAKGHQAEIKHASLPTRTSLKMQLMRIQAQEEDKRELEYSQSLKSSYVPTTVIDMPPVSSHQSTDVPAQILQVKTKLENPTKYHVIQKQKHQIQDFLNQSADHTMGFQSMPNFRLASTSDLQKPKHSGSAPIIDPDSPLSMGMSSTATSISEVESILNDLDNLESVDASFDDDLNLITPSLVQLSSTNPVSSNYVFSPVSPQTQAESAPTLLPGQRIATPTSFLCDDDARAWAKERIKKDNHNMIERRRRFNINDRIKELGTMLPKYIDPDLRQNKGSILKASVDYIRKLKRDQERLKLLEDKQRQTEAMNRKMMLKVQQLELLMRAQGLNNLQQDDMSGLSGLMTVVQPNTLTNVSLGQQQHQQQHQQVKQEVHEQLPCMKNQFTELHTTLNLDDLMEDSSGLSSDPMLSSQPVSPHMDDDSMDYIL